MRTINARRRMHRILRDMLKASAFTLLVVMALSMSGCATVVRIPGPPAADSGSVALGRVYAERTCASCHAVGPRAMRSPDPRARPFDSIANTPGMTRTALNAWLHSSHSNMPNLIVEPESVDDLYAYVLTLRRRA